MVQFLELPGGGTMLGAIGRFSIGVLCASAVHVVSFSVAEAGPHEKPSTSVAEAGPHEKPSTPASPTSPNAGKACTKSCVIHPAADSSCQSHYRNKKICSCGGTIIKIIPKDCA